MGMEHNELRNTGRSPGRRIRRGTLVLTVCAGLALGAGTPALAGTSSAGASGAAQVATPLAAPSGHTVTLPTGDRVTITAIGGKTSYSVVGPKGVATAYTSYDAFGDHFVVPDEAQPYLGKQLDSSLFDVSALLRAGATTGANIRVNLSFPPGATPSAPPGVTLTSNSTGYLTATSGAAFSAGLRASIGADVAAGRHPGTGALFGGTVSMSLATPGLGASATKDTVSPRFPLHILQINATDITGAPADALVFLLNVDSITRETAFAPIGGGIERVAVPAGNYAAQVLFDDFDSAGNLTALRTVTINDFAVSATAPVTTIGVDEHTATVPFAVTTPRPATSDGMQITYNRQDATGATFSFGNVIFGGGITVYSNSQPAPTVGKLHYVVQWDAAGPATGDQYRYDLAYGSSDIPANQSYTVHPGDVATVHHTFFTDPAAPAGGSFLNGTFDGPNVAAGQLGGGESYAGPLTQYLGTGDGAQWVQTYFAPSGLIFQGDVHTFRGGDTYEIEWAHGPIAPDAGKHTGPQIFFPCLACASGDVLVAAVNIDGDSEPDHVGFPLFGGTTHYTLYQNGVQVEDLGTGSFGAELTGVPVAPTTYRLVYDTDLTGLPGVSQSVTTHTDVTFHYVPGTDAKSTLPSTDPCDFTGAMATPCQVLPMLNLNYHLFTNTANTGETAFQGLELNVGHLTYDGRGSHAPITSAAVSVSFDAGKTWQQARVVKIGAFGSYDAFWTNPASAAGTSPELRVTATDALGGSITQTVTAAYTIAASVH